MRRGRTVVIVAVVCCLLTSGCTTYNGSRRVARTGGYVTIAGVSIAALGGGLIVIEGDGDMGTAYAAAGLGVLGLIVFVPGALAGAGGLIGMATFPRPPPPAPPAPPVPSPAHDLLRSAANLARRGDCLAALRLVERAADVDPPYAAQFAAGDEALAACARPTPASPAPP